MNKLFVKVLSDDAIKPTKTYLTDAGIDLYSLEDVYFKPFEIRKVRTGIALQLIDDYDSDLNVHPNLFIKIMDRSSIGMTPLLIKAGVIDNYTGEIFVVMQNVSTYDESLKKGTKFAQAVPLVKPTISEIVIVDDLLDTERKDNGFGHSG